MKTANYLRVSILCMFFLVLLGACESVDSENTCRTEVVETSDYLEVKPLIYKGHSYLWFRTKMRKGFGGITHDPDCPNQKHYRE